MEITVSKNYPYEFVLYLIRFFKKMLLGKIYIKRLKKIENDYNSIRNNSKDKQGYINIVDLVMNCDDYLTIKEFDREYKLGFNKDATFPNTNIKIIDIFKFINYGNAGITAYSIFTKTFLYIEKNLDTIYNNYCFTGGVF